MRNVKIKMTVLSLTAFLMGSMNSLATKPILIEENDPSGTRPANGALPNPETLPADDSCPISTLSPELIASSLVLTKVSHKDVMQYGTTCKLFNQASKKALGYYSASVNLTQLAEHNIQSLACLRKLNISYELYDLKPKRVQQMQLAAKLIEKQSNKFSFSFMFPMEESFKNAVSEHLISLNNLTMRFFLGRGGNASKFVLAVQEGAENLTGFTNLKKLKVQGADNMDPDSFSCLPQLRGLTVEKATLQGVGFERLTHLDFLSLFHCKVKVQAHSCFLGKLTNLTKLRLNHTRSPLSEDIGLGNLTNLTSLKLSGVGHRGEISNLGNLTKLERLTVKGVSDGLESQILNLQQSLPNLKITDLDQDC